MQMPLQNIGNLVRCNIHDQSLCYVRPLCEPRCPAPERHEAGRPKTQNDSTIGSGTAFTQPLPKTALRTTRGKERHPTKPANDHPVTLGNDPRQAACAGHRWKGRAQMEEPQGEVHLSQQAPR